MGLLNCQNLILLQEHGGDNTDWGDPTGTGAE
jgi:hypothetical protein